MKWDKIEKNFDESWGDAKDHPIVKSTKTLSKACYENGFIEGEIKGVTTGYIGGALAATAGIVLTLLWQSRK